MSHTRYTPGEKPGEQSPEAEKPEVDLTKLTTKELKVIAEGKGIDVEGLRKAEIIEAIKEEKEEEEEE